jgi:hypothetical protein
MVHDREYMIDLMGEPGSLLPSDRTVAHLSEKYISPKSSKTEHSSSFVSSTQSSPSGSTHSAHSMQSDMSDIGRDRKDVSIQKKMIESMEGLATFVKHDSRHYIEPADLQGPDLKLLRNASPNQMVHARSPSWTEGIGSIGGRQKVDVAAVSEEVSQLLINVAKENPQVLQKLQQVLIESGVDISSKQLQTSDNSLNKLQAEAIEDRKVEDERTSARGSSVPAHSLKKKNTAASGRPPTGSYKTLQEISDEGLQTKDRLRRLDSVEGMGDRRPLEPPLEVTTSVEASTAVEVLSPSIAPQLAGTPVPPVAALPVPLALGAPAALPMALATPLPNALPVALPIPVPVVAPSLGYTENSESISATDFVRNSVASAAAAAATAAVVASTMVAAAARGDPGGDPRMDFPIAAAATATAAVVAATSAVVGRGGSSNESSPVSSSHQPSSSRQPGSGRRETRVEEMQREGSTQRQRQSETRGSDNQGGSPGNRSSPGNSSRAPGNSGNGLDGEVSAEEERNSENESRQKKYDAILSDVAEWEIPWEDLVIGERIGLGLQFFSRDLYSTLMDLVLKGCAG